MPSCITRVRIMSASGYLSEIVEGRYDHEKTQGSEVQSSKKSKKQASQHPKTIHNLLKLLKWRLLDLFLSIPATGAVTLVPTIPATKPAPKWSIGPSSRPVFVLAKCLVCLGLFELMENLHQANYQFRSLPMKREAYEAYHPLADSDGMPRYS